MVLGGSWWVWIVLSVLGCLGYSSLLLMFYLLVLDGFSWF